MRDVAILSIVLLLTGLALMRPWIGVLALAVLGFMHPHGYAADFMQGFPAYKVVLAATVAGMIVQRTWRMPPFDWRLVLLAALLAWFAVTTFYAKVEWAAWPRLVELVKVFAAVALTIVLIDTREKLHWLAVTIAASFALVTLKGGYWAFMTGFSDRVYGPPDSQYYDNNLFAIATLMSVPLLLLWRHEATARSLRAVLALLAALSVAAALSSWSRGALLALVATGLVLVMFTPGKYARLGTLAAIGVAALVALVALPTGWFDRMHTIIAFEQDPSAQNRLQAWRLGIENAMAFPWTGMGFDSWHFAVGTMDWHSSYVEILAEHGFVGLLLWSSLLVGTLASLWRLQRRARRTPGMEWVARFAGMLIASLIAYAAGSIFLGLTYWDLLYQCIAMAILLSIMTSPIGRPPQAPLAAGPGGT